VQLLHVITILTLHPKHAHILSNLKLFGTSNMHVVSDCQEQFNFVLPSVQLARRAEKFVNKLHVDQVYLSLFFVCFFRVLPVFW